MISRILTIIDKEWAEVFKNRVVLFTVLLLPLIFTLLPVGMLMLMRSQGEMQGDVVDMPAMFARSCGILPAGECLQVFLLNQFLILFMIMPASIPIAIAAYSIVGEKTTHSLEPLLATPITTIELLISKCLAAAIPAITATWLCFLIFILLLPVVGITEAVRDTIGVTWLVAVFLVSPLMAIMAVLFSLMVSSRTSDPRTAEQISMIVIMPVLGLLFGQLGGVLVINSHLMIGTAFVFGLIDVGLTFISVDLFERETILTRWR